MTGSSWSPTPNSSVDTPVLSVRVFGYRNESTIFARSVPSSTESDDPFGRIVATSGGDDKPACSGRIPEVKVAESATRPCLGIRNLGAALAKARSSRFLEADAWADRVGATIASRYTAAGAKRCVGPGGLPGDD